MAGFGYLISSLVQSTLSFAPDTLKVVMDRSDWRDMESKGSGDLVLLYRDEELSIA